MVGKVYSLVGWEHLGDLVVALSSIEPVLHDEQSVLHNEQSVLHNEQSVLGRASLRSFDGSVKRPLVDKQNTCP